VQTRALIGRLVPARTANHRFDWVLLRSTYGSQMTDFPGFKIVGFAGAPLPSYGGPREPLRFAASA